MAFLELRGIEQGYAGQPLLRGLSFEVQRGEIVSLLGPSGSGKTTTLRIIAGLEPIERGEVWLEGRPVTHLPPHRRRIVLMFQDYALFPHRTVAENVAFGLRMQGWPRPRIEARVAEMLDLVGLRGFGGRDVSALSGGEQQRVALARSLAPNPRLLLLDEPLGALDRNLRERLLEELPRILRRVGVTTLTVTHDQEEAFALADRLILLHEGRVVQSGEPQAVYDRPATLWAARFLGMRNLFPAEIVGPPPRLRLPFGDFPFPRGQVGGRGWALLHPWGVRLHEGDLAAEVEAVAFHGATCALTLSLAEGTQLHLTLPAGRHPPRRGERLTLRIDPDALRWLEG